VSEKQTHNISREIDGRQLIHGLVELCGDEWDEQDQRITVATLRVECKVAFPHKVFQKETP
jgi:hypothetical protein